MMLGDCKLADSIKSAEMRRLLTAGTRENGLLLILATEGNIACRREKA